MGGRVVQNMTFSSGEWFKYISSKRVAQLRSKERGVGVVDEAGTWGWCHYPSPNTPFPSIEPGLLLLKSYPNSKSKMSRHAREIHEEIIYLKRRMSLIATFCTNIVASNKWDRFPWFILWFCYEIKNLSETRFDTFFHENSAIARWWVFLGLTICFI